VQPGVHADLPDQVAVRTALEDANAVTTISSAFAALVVTVTETVVVAVTARSGTPGGDRSGGDGPTP